MGLDAQWTKGSAALLVLSVLADGPLHGYAVLKELERRSAGAFELGEGTIYPLLRQLERDGFLEGGWSKVGGRRRREYVLTRAGRGELASRRRDFEAFRDAVERVIEAAAPEGALR